LRSPSIFWDAREARIHLEKLRWPFGPVCPACGNHDQQTITRLRVGSQNAGGRIHRPGLMQCRACRREFSVTVGTALEGKKLSFEKWVRAVHLMCSEPWMPATKLQREFSWPYLTAWRTAGLIKAAMKKEFVVRSGEASWGDRTAVAEKRDRILRQLLVSPPGMKGAPLRRKRSTAAADHLDSL